jgi:E3 ubiquitin-protein ligase BRE1
VAPADYNSVLRWQVEAQNQVVRKLEEKERLLQTNLATVEKVQFLNSLFFYPM